MLLLPCVHDVSPRHFERLVAFDEFYRRIGVGTCYAMLVVPDFNGDWPISQSAEFAAWLRERAAAGVEIFLHGYFHKDTSPPQTRSPRLRLQYALLGEGEFAAITYDEAKRRIAMGKALLEDVLGVSVDKFVAPAWQYNGAAHRALGEMGFKIAEDRRHVWDPSTGTTLSQTPVIAYSARSPLRRDLSIAWSRISDHALKDVRVVRHALHPADFDDSRLTEEIERSMLGFLNYRTVARYQSLVH